MELDEFDPGTFMNEYLSDLFLTAIFASLWTGYNIS